VSAVPAILDPRHRQKWQCAKCGQPTGLLRARDGRSFAHPGHKQLADGSVVMTAHSEKRAEKGQRPAWRRPGYPWLPLRLPATTQCQRCHTTALITEA
jgi:hypothetical protein